MLKISIDSDFLETRKYLKRLSNQNIYSRLDALAKDGVRALERATPKESGYTAGSWSYKINRTKNSCSISWTNSSITSSGTPIVILLQHGHGTGTGGYVRGRDFINPALRPVFDKISEKVWNEVRK